MWSGSLELQQPLPRWKGIEGLGLAAFVDAGQAAQTAADLRPAWGRGMGLRWRSPIGLLRADLAKGEKAWGRRLAPAHLGRDGAVRKRLIWGLALLTVLLLVGVLVGVLAGTSPVLRALAGPGFESLRGSLWSGLEAETLQGQGADGLRWRVEKLKLAAPRWQAGQWRFSAHLSRLQLDTGPGGGPPPDPQQVLALLRPRLPVTWPWMPCKSMSCRSMACKHRRCNSRPVGANWTPGNGWPSMPCACVGNSASFKPRPS